MELDAADASHYTLEIQHSFGNGETQRECTDYNIAKPKHYNNTATAANQAESSHEGEWFISRV